jgi:hypothetical protein
LRHSAHRWRQGCQSYAPVAFYPQEDSWYLFPIRGWVDPRAIVSTTRTGDLPACSIVPQPTKPPRVFVDGIKLKIITGILLSFAWTFEAMGAIVDCGWDELE